MKFLLLFMFSYSAFSQIRGVVIDSLGMPIPYVNIWVSGENVGTTSEEDGTFGIKDIIDKILIFSAVGFETKKVNSNNLKKVILYSRINNLEEVKIVKKSGHEKKEIGKINKNKINYYYSATSKPYIIATKIKPLRIEENKLFISELSFLTLSQLNKAKINLRFFNVDKEGKPGGDYLNNNILVEVKKGKNINTISLDKFNVVIPKEGIFIGFEWLIVDENKFIQNSSNNEEKSITNYEPKIGMIPSLTQDNWEFSDGNWIKGKITTKFDNFKTIYDDKFQNIAFSLKLTN